MNSTRRPLSARKKILFTVFTFILFFLALGVLELACRFYDSLEGKTRFDALSETDVRLGWRLRPGYRDPRINVNALGLRGPETTWEKRTPRRLIVLGNSCVFGTGSSSDTFSFPGQLQQFLDPAGETWEVLNGGVPGYTSKHVLLYLKERLLPLQPDVVLFYGGWNDMRYVSDPLAEIEQSPWRQFSRLMALKSSLYFHLRNTVGRLLQLATISGRQDQATAAPPPDFTAVHAMFRRNIETMAELAEQNGFRLVLVDLYTILEAADLNEPYLGRILVDRGADRDTDRFADVNGISRDRIVECARDFNRNLAAVALADSLPRFLTSALFRGLSAAEHQPLFTDYSHYSDTGCALLGSGLAEFIRGLPESETSPDTAARAVNRRG